MKILCKHYRAIKRGLRNRKLSFAIAVLLVVGALSYATYMQNRRLTVDPATYTPLLQLIARAESNDNYNAYFGHGGKPPVNLVAMPIADVMEWQADYIAEGNASSAVGRYQIIDSTLDGLVRQLDIDPRQKFDQATQDKMAIALLERRGAERYINDELSPEQFAANLAKEWAALPRVIGDEPDKSYYASDGLNKSRVSIPEVMKAIEPISPK